MNRLAIFLLALTLTACGSVNLDAPLGENPLIVQASPTSAVSLIVLDTFPITPQPTLTATQAGTPTTDYQARVGQAQLDLQYSLGTATMAAVTEQAVVKTSTALQSIHNGTASATVAAGQRAATSTAAVTQTLEAQALQTASAKKTATVQAPITQKLQTEADWAPVWQGLGVVFSTLLGLLVLWYVGHIGYQWLKLVYEKRLALAPELQPAGSLDIKLDQRDAYGWGAVDFSTLPIDRVTLRDVAELLTCGIRYTQAQLTGAGKPLVKDGSFNTFGDWMVKYHIAVKVDGRYSIQHMEFFEQVLAG